MKVWLLYVGPVIFEGIIDEELYTRFLMFSYCVRLLMISAEYCDESQRLLKSYLDKTETAYTKTAFSANLHAVSHLSEQVRNFGPLWVSSAMMFESANYLLKSKFTGTVNHLQLMIERYIRNKKNHRAEICTDSLFDLCHQLRRTSKSFKKSYVSPLTVPESLRSFNSFSSNQKLNSWEITSILHSSDRDSYVSFTEEGFEEYGQVHVFFVQDGVDMVYIKKLETKTLYRCADARVRVISFVTVNFSDRYDAMPLASLSGKLLRVDVGEAVHLIPLLNVFEHD